MGEEIIRLVREKLLENEDLINFDEASKLAHLEEEFWLDLVSLSHRVTAKYLNKGVYLCSIIGAKSGACSEDCSFCAQSAHNKRPITSHPMTDPESLLKSAKEVEGSGASEFCIVTSGKGPDKETFRNVLEAVYLIRGHTNLSVGCSLGILTEEEARLLSKAGVNRYNHNLEASRSFFPNICTTHTYEERLRTAYLVKKNGMELCCGGIFGMGE